MLGDSVGAGLPPSPCSCLVCSPSGGPRVRPAASALLAVLPVSFSLAAPPAPVGAAAAGAGGSWRIGAIKALTLSSLTAEQEQEFNLPSATRDCLEPITPGQIRSAAKRFPKSTSQTWDGFRPRHFAFLSNQELEHVCKLLAAIAEI